MSEELEELNELLRRVRVAQEILGLGGFDCVYLASKELEVVAFRLEELVRETNQ